MLTAKHPPQRNIIDLADSVQVKKLTKRLGISKDALFGVVKKMRQFDCWSFQRG